MSTDSTRRAAALRLEAENLNVEAAAAVEDYKREGGQYLVRCEHCGEAYSWLPEMNLRNAACGKCNKTYDAEFGVMA